jgi:hypothetical protein
MSRYRSTVVLERDADDCCQPGGLQVHRLGPRRIRLREPVGPISTPQLSECLAYFWAPRGDVECAERTRGPDQCFFELSLGVC